MVMQLQNFNNRSVTIITCESSAHHTQCVTRWLATCALTAADVFRVARQQYCSDASPERRAGALHRQGRLLGHDRNQETGAYVL